MQIKTDGVILKTQNYNEDDKLLTILTRELGVVYAYANGARRMKSRFAAASSLFCYADLVLFRKKGKYIVDLAEPRELFFGLHAELEHLAAASYFCELALELAPAEEPAGEFLRLLLNTLHFLEKKKRPLTLLKPLFELRLLSMAGYAPDLTACADCGESEGETMWLSPTGGDLVCENCWGEQEKRDLRLPLASGTLAAMRHIAYAPDESLFSFTLGEENAAALELVCEQAVLCQTERGYGTLDFLRQLRAL